MSFEISPATFSAAEKLLWKYGISTPEEIALEAIAFDSGIVVRRRPLEGCDARLVAVENRGVITINSSNSPQRQRFSIGHELAHWFHDRSGDGMLSCSKDDVSPRNQRAKSMEADANRFSADLLLPPYLVVPRITRRDTNIHLAQEVAHDFTVSVPAAAIRIVRHSKQAASVVVHKPTGRAWYFCNSSWPDYVQLAPQVHHDSPAMELLFGGSVGAKTPDKKEPALRWVYGEAMFASQVMVQSLKRYDGQIISIVRVCGK
jgi:Zn-dependent peptidase ImmA (M78 family)